MLPLGDLAGIELWVERDHQVDAATAIANRYLEQKVSSDTEPAWICEACGEENPGNFAVCWQCAAERKT